MLFLLGVIVSSGLVFGKEDRFSPYYGADNWGYGGIFNADWQDKNGVLAGASAYSSMLPAISGDKAVVFDGALILGSSDPLSNLVNARNGLKKYKVRSGDTLSSIAAQFGISLETIRWANPSTPRTIRPGDELTILPVSGVLYEIRYGDTIESVSNRYRIDPEFIKRYNQDYQKLFEDPGVVVILPYAKPTTSGRYTAQGYAVGLPDLKNYFIFPVQGWNWGELHDYNAVDIANKCGTPVYAAAEGVIIPDDRLGDGADGWNNGYGRFILIEHPNGTKTRYTHLLKSLVGIGDFVSQGTEIGLVGNSGSTDGPTGCHLHFEVYGARNPFAIR